jgi:hypothetical protein
MPFPPYRLLERDYLLETQEKFGRLERLYHNAQAQAWDGKAVLKQLLAKHGGIHISDDKREAIGQLFSTILWGELAAWSISADLALMLEDTEAKMAATSQAFDEARHFYVMRDYLIELGGEVPHLDGYTHTVLNDLVGTHRLVDKLLGMQLIVESVALTLFRSVAEARVEPVLSDLMPYYERDESRHVALGVMYLPALLDRIGPLESARLQWLQLKILTFIGWGTHVKKPYFERLGIDNNIGMHRGMKLQHDTFEKLRQAAGGRAPAAVIVGDRSMEAINEQGIDFFFPRIGSELPGWQQKILDFCYQLARVGERALRAAA